MNWKNLKDFKCPKCGYHLAKSIGGYRCGVMDCGFSISSEKFDELVLGLYQPPRRMFLSAAEDDDTRLGELNNYGREKPTDDFSDSPHLN